MQRWQNRSDAHVLVLEDNGLIAFDVEEALRHLGFGHIAVVSSVRDAMQLMDGPSPRDFSIALVDLSLGDGSSDPVIAAVQSRGGAVVIITGDAAAARVDADTPVVTKPFTHAQLHAAIEHGWAKSGGDR